MRGKIRRIDGGYVIDLGDRVISVSRLQLDTFLLPINQEVEMIEPTPGYLTLHIDNTLMSVRKC